MATKAGDDPESLMSLCTVFCLKNLRRTMCYMGERNQLCLRPDIFLPSEICDKLVHMYMELVHTDSKFEPQDGFFQLFSDPHSTRLSRLHLREDVVRDRDLKAISKQDLMELHLTDCIGLHQSLCTLRNFRNTLMSLSLFGCINIFPESSTDDEDDDNSSSSSSSSSSSTEDCSDCTTWRSSSNPNAPPPHIELLPTHIELLRAACSLLGREKSQRELLETKQMESGERAREREIPVSCSASANLIYETSRSLEREPGSVWSSGQ